MCHAKLPLFALFALSASAAAAQTAKPPAPARAPVNLLQAVRLHAAALRSEPIRLNSEPLRPLRANPPFAEDALPPGAMTGQERPDVALVFAPPVK